MEMVTILIKAKKSVLITIISKIYFQLEIMSDDVKLLKDLKVSELKNELEIRDLVTSGVKSVLADRLKNYLVENGLDPETYDFNEENPDDSENAEDPVKV